ncbi:DMT family transporter [Pseudoxanthomonas sp. LjRoot168]|uniref:DMT family transporter n=1 Tax=unclassified Pseudoxanthomonas TaxID=2645906 RepID=UPI0025DD60C9|nr:DMT family transporter [Pseudoxanthomonas sp.]
MNATGVALALFIGMLLPLQALINASLGRQTFGPVFASLASFMVGTGVLLAWWLLTRPVFVPAALGKVPWWAWTGGVIGAVFVASATLLVPRLGAASLICLVVAGQLVGSVVLDHFGVLHPRQPVDVVRMAGLLLVVAGAVLVVKPWQGAGG